MKTVTIKQIEISNFKGCQKRTVVFNDGITRITGGNETGKSTIFDAYLWALTGKNQRGENAVIQPRDRDTWEEIRRIHPEVVMHFEVRTNAGVEELKLGKIQAEKWTTPRGQVDEVFVGNENEYYVNDVKVAMKDYNTKLAEILPAGAWAIVSNLNVFFSLKTEERRKVLIEMIDEINDLEIATAYPLVLDHINAGRKDVKEMRANCSSRKKNANDTIKNIPTAIKTTKELIRTVDEGAIRQAIAEKDTHIKELESNLITGVDSELTKELAGLRNELSKLRQENQNLESEFEAYWSKEETQYNTEHHRRTMEINNKISIIQKLEQDIKSLEADIVIKTNSKDSLIKEYEEEQSKTAKIDGTCYNCKQPLPANMIDDQESKFNREKRDKLNSLDIKGQQLYEEIEKLQEQKVTKKANLDTEKVQLQSLETSLEQFESIKQDKEDVRANHGTIHQVNANLQTIAEIEIEIKELEDNQPETIDNTVIESEIRTYKAERDELVKSLNQVDVNASLMEDIERLENELKINSQAVADCELEEMQINEFNRTRISLIEDGVSDLFNSIRFKMFEPNKTNDGERQICEAYKDGIPYAEINDASQMEIGVEIIRGLSNYYKVNVPIFIDRYESMEKSQFEKAQVIALEVVKGQREIQVI